MNIVCIGGGPAGLYFSLLMKKAHPEVELKVIERNRADDTFGWGVVFSDETLGNFEEADPESYARITSEFAYWGDIETYFDDTCIRSTGHGFAGLARKRLLEILQERCVELGVELEFEREFNVSQLEETDEYKRADLVVACDGVNSAVRERYAEHFRPTTHWGSCRFSWLGTDKPLSAFTFIFRENEHGLFRVHAYPFQEGLSTFIVECREETWRSAGLDEASEAETVEYVQALFSDHLKGQKLLTNRSLWRSFPTIHCESWHHGKVVLLGDAAHTAHFSIGSGTKLAMEDSIALQLACSAHGLEDVPRVLRTYEEARLVETIKTQKAARTSRDWFENTERYANQHPLQFNFNLMTRSKRITYENLRLRDPKLVESVSRWWGESQRPESGAAAAALPPMFSPLRLRDLELENRVVVSPMCQYSAEDGLVDEWHMVHLGSRAVGGAGLLLTEMTDVSAQGRITHGCAGLWSEEQASAWKRIVDFVHLNTPARIGVQLAHAGRKGSCRLPWDDGQPLSGEDAWETLAPSPLPFGPGWPTPRAMERADMEAVRDQFVRSTELALAADFDLIELHLAHGYLLSSFISPASNQRSDEYGGSLENRLRFPLEVFDAMRSAWPAARPMAARISATDWLPGDLGLTADDAVAIASTLKEHGCDLVDVSSGGNTPESEPEFGRMYHVPFAERIKHEVGITVCVVGAIQGHDHVNTVLAAGRADLCALARPHLLNPYLTLGAAVEYEHVGNWWPKQYQPARPEPPAG